MEVPEVQGFELVVILVGVVQFVKEKFELQGKWAEVLTLGLGALLFGYWSAMQVGVISEGVILWIGIVIRALGYTLAAPGLYKVAKHEFLPAVGGNNATDN